MGRIVMITGGARSGKSDFALSLAGKAGENVLFVATAHISDEEMRRRVEKHRGKRPRSWTTEESTRNVGELLASKGGEYDAIIIDCLSNLVSNIVLAKIDVSGSEIASEEEERAVEDGVKEEVEMLIRGARKVKGLVVVVTNEVGMGVVPMTKAGRIFRDALGMANKILASHADDIYLMVSGIPIPIKSV